MNDYQNKESWWFGEISIDILALDPHCVGLGYQSSCCSQGAKSPPIAVPSDRQIIFHTLHINISRGYLLLWCGYILEANGAISCETPVTATPHWILKANKIQMDQPFYLFCFGFEVNWQRLVANPVVTCSNNLKRMNLPCCDLRRCIELNKRALLASITQSV